MATTLREAFERGTETFNAHDIEGFAEVLADDVAFKLAASTERTRQLTSRSLGVGSVPFPMHMSTCASFHVARLVAATIAFGLIITAALRRALARINCWTRVALKGQQAWPTCHFPVAFENFPVVFEKWVVAPEAQDLSR